ncbi:OTU domain-containing protein 6B [Elsinoe ampelina]|uniref:OTU domain-containing protein 6B n=1 Tax=Elsinoe ampelina TaxID=302913 RepID=A0A6A6GEB1_9PEZI|nr:OTU domain-containing protein 6B [Elsinoe ampelina]
MEELQARHRKEAKDLQNKITSKKKQASKKTRKGVNDECDRLEQELKQRHEAEIADLSGQPGEPQVDTLPANEELANETASLSINGDSASTISAAPTTATSITSDTTPEASQQTKRIPRARARLERRKAEQEALFNQASAEASNLPDLKAQERDRMVANFKSRGLVEKEIRADGHCLYSAFADQMEALEMPLLDTKPGDEAKLEEYKVVRKEAAAFMQSHPDDFAPFLEEGLDTYTMKIKDTAEWGGQMELIALARRYGVQINVLQGDGRVEEIKAEEGARSEKVLWLAYYKHGFGLGEHYNSLRKA